MSESEKQYQQSSVFPTAGYEAAEEEKQSLEDEEEGRNTSVADLDEEEGKEEEESPSESPTVHKRGERRVGKRRS